MSGPVTFFWPYAEGREQARAALDAALREHAARKGAPTSGLPVVVPVLTEEDRATMRVLLGPEHGAGSYVLLLSEPTGGRP